MSNLVIVAIPADDDDVWRVSSERKPHMTICFLGPAETNPNVDAITSYVKEQTARLAPFSLRVDHRGVLGVDEADVLFFADDIPWPVHDFRDRLLSDVNIRSAYNSIQQHAKWTPHLTLGYKATPANKDNWDPMGVQYVKFNKIGVWFSDFGGIEIPLVDNTPKLSMIPSMMDTVMEWGATTAGEILAHHGVKGQKWGVRRSGSTSAVTVAQKGKKLKSTGGEGHKPSSDALKAKTLGQIKKKSGVHALSNEELQAYSKRLNLEQNVKQLEVKQPGAKNWIKRTLTKQGDQHINSAASSGAKAIGKAALAAA